MHSAYNVEARSMRVRSLGIAGWRGWRIHRALCDVCDEGEKTRAPVGAGGKIVKMIQPVIMARA